MNQLPQRASSPNPIFGIISLVLGIIGLFMMIPSLLIWLCSIIPFFLGVIAIVVGAVGVRKVAKDPANYGGRVLSYIGIGVGLLSVILPVLWVLVSLIFFAYFGLSQPRRYF